MTVVKRTALPRSPSPSPGRANLSTQPVLVLQAYAGMCGGALPHTHAQAADQECCTSQQGGESLCKGPWNSLPQPRPQQEPCPCSQPLALEHLAGQAHSAQSWIRARAPQLTVLLRLLSSTLPASLGVSPASPSTETSSVERRAVSALLSMGSQTFAGHLGPCPASPGIH